MALTELKVKAAKPQPKPYKLADERGMYLYVYPAGGKLWRMDYRFDGKRKTLAIGAYPDVSLATARSRRDEARSKIANGVDPSAFKKAVKAARLLSVENSFKAVGLEWIEKQRSRWSEKHFELMFNRLDHHVYPFIGSAPVADVKAPAVLGVLQRLEHRRRLHTAERVKQVIGMVMRYAVATGRAEYDPTPSLKGAIETHTGKHMASVTDPVRVGAILRMFDAFDGTLTVRTALFLAPLVFCRPGELRQMRWSQLNLDEGLWELDRGSMKMRREHIVPLSRQAIELIRGIEPFSGHLEFVLPNARNPKRAMSDAAVNAGMRRLGIDTQEELTGHGFRAMARTIIRERLKFDAEIIECQLSHAKKGALGDAYDRTQFLPERIEMMQAWADYLDDLKAGKVKASSATG